MKVFVAVPKITSPETIEQMRELVGDAGFEAVFAADVEPKNPRGTPNDKKLASFNAIRKAMKESDILIANLTPFIGVEPDPDVTFQLGYMAAQQKPAFSYTNVSAPFYDRVKTWNGAEFATDEQKGDSGNIAILKRDRDGMRIENMGIRDRSITLDTPGADNYNNLMLEGPSMKTGSAVLTPANTGAMVTEDALYTNLDVFKKNLKEARHAVLEEEKTKADAPPEKEEKPMGAYLAGPDVFLPELMDHFAAKKQITSQAGIEGVAPVDAQMDFGLMQTWALKNGNNPRMREGIYDADTGVMQSVRMGIFNLTPFHGATADSGTIFEAGYMVGKDDALGRKPMVFGYSNDARPLTARILHWNGQPQGEIYGGDRSQYEGVVYSPMLDGAILASGGLLRHNPNAATVAGLEHDKRFSYLSAFEAAATEAAKITKENSLNGGKEGRNRYGS